jgi:hypothetical protein
MAENAGKEGKELPAVTGNRQALLDLPLEEYKRYEAQVERTSHQLSSEKSRAITPRDTVVV